MKKFILAASVFSSLVFVSVFAAAQAVDPVAEEVSPESVVLGEILIKFANTDYPSVRVDGESWDDTEYAEDGKQVFLHKTNRTMDHTILLVPGFEGLAEAEFVIKPSDWKLIKLNKLDRTWRAEKLVKFVNAPVKPKKPAPPAEESETVPVP
jgi:hypothetical protein